jgi:hypothetical protein
LGFIRFVGETKHFQPPLTPTVETVEKVPFQKIILKSGTETLKST